MRFLLLTETIQRRSFLLAVAIFFSLPAFCDSTTARLLLHPLPPPQRIHNVFNLSLCAQVHGELRRHLPVQRQVLPGAVPASEF